MAISGSLTQSARVARITKRFSQNLNGVAGVTLADNPVWTRLGFEEVGHIEFWDRVCSATRHLMLSERDGILPCIATFD
jgi:hypothetical protein